MSRCLVPGCPGHESVFRVPRKPAFVFAKWVARMPFLSTLKVFTDPRKRMRICKLHFKPECFSKATRRNMLIPFSLPSLLLPGVGPDAPSSLSREEIYEYYEQEKLKAINKFGRFVIIEEPTIVVKEEVVVEEDYPEDNFVDPALLCDISSIKREHDATDVEVSPFKIRRLDSPAPDSSWKPRSGVDHHAENTQVQAASEPAIERSISTLEEQCVEISPEEFYISDKPRDENIEICPEEFYISDKPRDENIEICPEEFYITDEPRQEEVESYEYVPLGAKDRGVTDGAASLNNLCSMLELPSFEEVEKLKQSLQLYKTRYQDLMHKHDKLRKAHKNLIEEMRIIKEQVDIRKKEEEVRIKRMLKEQEDMLKKEEELRIRNLLSKVFTPTQIDLLLEPR